MSLKVLSIQKEISVKPVSVKGIKTSHIYKEQVT